MNSKTISQGRIPGSARTIVQLLLVSGGMALFAGCESTESHVVSAPPPSDPVATQAVVVQQQPAQVVVAGSTQSVAGTIIVTQAPPAMQQEVVQARPSSAHVWVPGYWSWRNNRYEWMSGHWEIPPRTDAVWVAPRWERLGDGSYRSTKATELSPG
ncbi:MAG: YXWGXW repeat-containing protein [Lacunisphaera sp.]